MIRDDRVLGATRLLGAVIVPFLLVAFALLYLFPGDTAHWFAWTIKPRMTPLIMGAGYIAGGYFFLRVVTASHWHRVHLGFLPITAFTIFGVGVVQSAVAAVLLLAPSTMIDSWPWTLTPLTAQVLGGWFALPSVVAIMMALDGRWSAIRITLESQVLGETA